MTDGKTKLEDGGQEERRIQVDDEVMYRNILGEWHQGTVIKVNNTTVRILNKKEFKILSLKWDNVLSMDDYNALENK